MTTMPSPVLEFRVALTAADYDQLVAFYQESLGLEAAEQWTNEYGRGIVFDMGRATLEVLDEPQAAAVDQIEAGQRVSGPIRFAWQVPDLDRAVERLTARGATLVHPPVVTPWQHYNARLRTPDGLQLTLFQVLD